MKKNKLISRRTSLKGIGAAGAFSLFGTHELPAKETVPDPALSPGTARKAIYEKVWQTPLIDTHEHLIEEADRLQGTDHPRVQSDDWSLLFSHYLDSDLLTSGMPEAEWNRFFSPEIDPVDKWKILEPCWPAVKNTGYGQAVHRAIRELYGVEDLSAKTVRAVQAGYEKTRKPGFYRHILCDTAKIESCQVNCLGRPFLESKMPTLLMQDLSILGMFAGPNIDQYSEPTGRQVKCLDDWHKVIDWWFAKYAKYAVAVKSQQAYSRDIDYETVDAPAVENLFAKRLENQDLTGPEQKALEDHLFWYAVERATENHLPVKLHTGYYAGCNSMPLGRLIHNPGSATDLCRRSPDSRFVFMHICYPYYEELISVAKQYTNAYVDMCWSWIINPIAAKDFLKKYLVTAPANKVLTFGGDYIPVEPVLGHAIIARMGIAQALSELVEEGWIAQKDALDLVDTVMHENARRIFNLKEKTTNLKKAPWG
ncbi:MAG: amidohydrolase family protein [Sedimentisphaerales bacterium]|nr:amidohydrolase family protein [Sedimentisphaerales bacterium]